MMLQSFRYKRQGRRAQSELLVCAQQNHLSPLCMQTGVLSSCRTGRGHGNESAEVGTGV